MTPKPPKIFHLITSLNVGGTERFLLSIVKNLHQEFDFEVAYLKEKGTLGETIEAKNWARVRGLKGWRDFWKWTREGQPDILHTHMPRANLYGCLLRMITWFTHKPSPVIIASHRAMGYFNLWNRYYWGFFLDSFPFLSSVPHVLITNSKALKDRLIRISRVPADKIYTLYNGFDPERVKAHMDQKEARAKCGLPQGKIIVGSLMRLHHQKYTDLLPNLIKKVHRRNSNVFFAIAGNGPEYQHLENELKTQDPQGKSWKLLKHIYPISPFLKSLDICFLLSRDEGFPNVLLEAMGAGLPCIANNVGGVSELIQDEKTGYIVQTPNSSLVAKTIDKVIQNPLEAKKIGEQAREYVMQHHPMDEMIDNLRELYLDCIQ